MRKGRIPASALSVVNWFVMRPASAPTHDLPRGPSGPGPASQVPPVPLTEAGRPAAGIDPMMEMAAFGVDYYVRLERGRAPGVSADVLNALAEALRLSDVEREYLGNLGAPTWPRPTLGTRTVRPAMQALVDSITNVPAYVIGPLCDVLAWNRLACAVFTDFSAIPAPRRTWSHLLYLHEDIQRLFHDWEAAGAENVAVIRMQTSRLPTDPEL